MFGNTLERAVFHYGIEVDRIIYQSQELGELRRRLARPNARHPRVVLKITSGDPGCIYVLDPQAKTYLKVPAVIKRTGSLSGPTGQLRICETDLSFRL
jgi:hypothetical protein